MSSDPAKGGPGDSVSPPASESQLEKLTEAIVRSQHNYRELIDNLDQALFTLTQEGIVRVANLRLAEVLGASFQELIGRPLSEFVESPTLSDAVRSLPVLLKAGAWSGTIPVRLKKDGALRFFDCWLQTSIEGGNTSIIGWARDITQRREMEKRLAEEQSFTRRLVAGFPDLVAVLDRDGRFIYISDQVERVSGYKASDYVGHAFGKRANAEDRAKLETTFERIVSGQETEGQVEFRSPHADGTYRDLLMTARPFFDEDGKISGIVTATRDITGRKQMEQKLRESEESLRFMIEGVRDHAIFMLGPEGKVASWNLGAERMKGYSAGEIIGKHFSIFHPSEAAQSVQPGRLLETAAEKGQAVDEGWRVRKDGTRFFANVVITAVRDGNGKLLGFSKITRDVTAKHEIERKLHHEQQFVKSLVECFPDLIVVLNAKGEFQFVSDRVKDILGVSPEEYIGKPLGQRVEAADRGKLKAMFDAALAGQKDIEQIEIHARHIDGTIKTVRVTANALYDENGQIVGMVSSGRDVTESKQLEQQLVDKEKFAAIGQMMAGAAHELNNPLTAILGVSDLLRERTSDDAGRRQVELIHQQARRAATIVQNLLAVSRPVARGRTTLRLEEVVKEAVSIERLNLEKRNIKVALASLDAPLPIDGDRKLLLQVFLNIIANAEQSISPAREQGRLNISFSREGDKVSVAFADDGPGIPADIIGKIFDPFFTTKRPGGGSGLGLTISLAVIKEHGGTIAVDSKQGEGAVVRVTLPAAIEKVLPPAPEAPAAKPAAASRRTTPLSGHLALIVDDEEGIREIVQESLTGQGMNVHAVDSAEAALAWLAEKKTEIVVCDLNLPKMNGEKLFEELQRRMGGSVPRFVFITGELVSSSVAEHFQEKGARVLQKPFGLSALAALVTELLETQATPAK